MAIRPKGEKRPEPAPEGMRTVMLIYPATYPEGVKNDAKSQLTVPENIAEAWDAAGVAMVID